MAKKKVRAGRTAARKGGGAKVEAATALVERARTAAGAKKERDASRAEELLALIERRKVTIAEDFYDIGAALRELAQDKLYAALGLRSFEELLAKRGVMGRTQAFKLIEVVKTFSRGQALALGQEKAYALIRYTAATPADDDPREIASSGKLGRRSLAAMGRRDVEDAVRDVRTRVRGSAKAKVSPEERAANAAARTWQAALRASGAKKATAKARKVEGAWCVEARVAVDAVSRIVRR